jgi:hypothetical protein
MRKRLAGRRPSAAMVVAMTALVMAFTGPAIADQVVSAAKKINGKDIKSRSIAGNRLRNDTVTGIQVSESKLGKVPSASKADSATSAATATNAANAANATNAANAANASSLSGASAADLQDPAAYAVVFESPVSLDAAYSKNVLGVSPGLSSGTYCFDLPFVPKSISVTNHIATQSDMIMSAAPGAAQFVCAAGAEASAQSYEISASANTFNGGSFFIQFYR